MEQHEDPLLTSAFHARESYFRPHSYSVLLPNIFNLRGHLLYQAWFQQLPFASLLLDQSGKIMKINSAFHRLSGYAENEVKGKPYSALFQCECSALNDFSLPFRTKEIVLNLSDGQSKRVMLDCHHVQMGNAPFYFLTIQDITAQKREVRRMQYLAYHDNLTGLANLHQFQKSFTTLLDKAKQSGQILACLVVDIDDFKKVNDTMGHLAGDALLKVIAERLTHCVRHHDLVVRFGGDEFVILMIVPDAATVSRLSEKLMEHLNRPIIIGERTWSVSPTIGISLYPEHGTESEQLLQKADKAMYVGKHNGKNQFWIYSPEMERC